MYRICTCVKKYTMLFIKKEHFLWNALSVIVVYILGLLA